MFREILVCCFVQLLFVLSVEGVSLTLNPPYMMVGSSSASPVMRFEIICSSSGSPGLDFIFQLKINRRKSMDVPFTTIASMRSDTSAKLDPAIPQDIQAKSPNVTGSIDNISKLGILTVSMNGQGLTCSDQAEFQCFMNYADNLDAPHLVEDNKNFTVSTAPNDVLMDSPEYYDNKGNTLQLVNNSVLSVDTRIKYRCTANIGSLPEGEIIWERSSELGTFNTFAPYIPTLTTDIVPEVSRQDGCFYRRTSTMYYNLTKLDEDGITFRCKARTYLGGQLYEALSNQQFRTVTAPSGGTSKTSTLSGTTSEAGVIAGAVIGSIAGVVLIIVVIYFLCYRRRSSGESYRTKEEGERPEPPPTDYTYSMPDKKKNDGYDNKGLDDHSEKTTRYPRSGRGGFDGREGRNDRGHHNPGMEDEDGGTMHMSSGPIGTGV